MKPNLLITVLLLAGLLAGCDDAESAQRTAPAAGPTASPRAAGAMNAPAISADKPTGVDPVCLMTVATGPNDLHAEHGGHTYHFCSEHCRDAFVEDPSHYVAATTRPTTMPAAAADASRDAEHEKIPPYQPRFGRSRPVVAVLCANGGTVLSDFVVPYGVLARSGVAEVAGVSTEPGEVLLRPLKGRVDMTTAEFDARYPEGADYVVVPAVADPREPAVLAFITAQSEKGGTIVSICEGSVAVAHTGLLDGRRATSWFGSEAGRVALFPAVRWQRNIRYVADGRFVSSSGFSASIPTSVALVEAIAGREQAAEVAAELGVDDWSAQHDSDAFQMPDGEGFRLPAPSDDPLTLGVPVAPGVDEIALALMADAYSTDGRTQALAVATSGADADGVTTRSGLVILPDRVAGGPDPVDRLLPPPPNTRPVSALDAALADIAASDGRPAAEAAARMMEYPFDPE